MAYSDPIAFSILWTTYGTWLPGDQRGWTRSGAGTQPANPLLERWSRAEMAESELVLNSIERSLVNRTISEVCQHRDWKLHVANARINHVHAVVSSDGRSGTRIRDDLKAWCTRRLKERQTVLLQTVDVEQLEFDRVREHWWTEGGFAKPLYTETELEAAIVYAGDAQDHGGSKGNHAQSGLDYPRETRETDRTRESTW